jgi:hypothetical protein
MDQRHQVRRVLTQQRQSQNLSCGLNEARRRICRYRMPIECLLLFIKDCFYFIYGNVHMFNAD